MKEGNRFPLFLITPNGEFVMSLSPAKQKFVEEVEAKTRSITEFIDNRIEEIESKDN